MLEGHEEIIRQSYGEQLAEADRRDKRNTIDRLVAESLALEQENEKLKKQLADIQAAP